MKKYIFGMIAYLLNYIIIKGIIYCSDLISTMSTDKQSTLMAYYTFGLFILELLVFTFSIILIQKYVVPKEK